MERKITHIATNMHYRFSYKVAIFIVLKIENFRNIDHLIFSYNYQRKTNSALMGTLCPFVVHVRISSTLISDTEISPFSRLHGDGKGGYQSHFRHQSVTIQSTEWQAHLSDLSVNLYILKKTPKLRHIHR